jgi:hypothetical protein
MKSSSYYQHKNEEYACEKCGWTGRGAQVVDGDEFGRMVYLVRCPQCHAPIGFVSHPTIAEMLQYGTEEDKAAAQQSQEFLNRVWASELKSIEPLPDIDAERIIFSLREEVIIPENKEAYIVLCWGEREVWREVRSFEYYPRYLQLGELLKEKYGERLADFAVEYTVYLGGDSLSAFDKVREFRRSLARA